MAQRPILLAEHPPEFSVKGGLFYVDVGIADAPLLAYKPHDLLKAIRAAAQLYAAWTNGQGAEVPELAERR